MSKIQFIGKVSAEMMAPRISGDQVWYSEEEIEARSYACLGESCGLIWDRKHHAEKCESKGHAPEWSQGYGGKVENGVYKPAVSYVRRAIGRLSRASMAKHAPKASAHEHTFSLSRYCGVLVCDDCKHHQGRPNSKGYSQTYARCYCGWAADGGNGKAQLTAIEGDWR